MCPWASSRSKEEESFYEVGEGETKKNLSFMLMLMPFYFVRKLAGI